MTVSDAHPVTPEHDAIGDLTVSSAKSRRDPDNDDRNDTPGGMDQEDVEDRPNVGIVEPDDHPEQQ